MSRRPSNPPDFVAEIRLLPEQRKHFIAEGLATGFRAAHDFHHPENGLNDGMHILVDREFLPLGAVGRSEVWLLFPERQRGRFFAGFEFNIHAGTHVLGNGFIVEVVNRDLAKRT